MKYINEKSDIVFQCRFLSLCGLSGIAIEHLVPILTFFETIKLNIS